MQYIKINATRKQSRFAARIKKEGTHLKKILTSNATMQISTLE